MNELDDFRHRKQQVKDLVMQYGGIDEDQHKQWLIDAILRTLFTEEEYHAFLDEYNVPGYCPWEQGIAP